MVLGFGLTIYFCWRHVSPQVLASSEYRVEVDNVVITPSPPWIHSDIRKEVFEDLSVEGPMSIMDPDVTKRFKDVFALHPWVDHVVKVSKCFPARIEVDLEYRQPACMVATSRQWFPVDVKGYVLPWSDFSPSDLQELPKVVGIDTLPVISEGAYWNDKQVDAAARIGEVLRPVWKEMQLETIQPAQNQSGARSKEVKNFELTTKAGTVIIWGKSPTPKTPSEKVADIPSNQDKIARLKNYFNQNHGTLDVPGNRVLDLRVSPSGIANL